jgi:predicted PurR-regulated permease PerM
MERLGLPSYAGATIVVLGLLGALGAAGWTLAGPVEGIVNEAPQRLSAAQSKFERLRSPVRQATEIADRIERATEVSPPERGRPPQPAPPAHQAPGAIARIFGRTASLLGAAVEVVLLLFLLLASGDLFLQKLVKLLPMLRDKAEAVRTVGEVEQAVLRYLLATLVINVVQGAVIGLVLWALGVPGWWMWGLVTVVVEFIPYLGATVMIVLLLVVAFASFDSLGRALAAPGSYLVITTLQNNVVSPYAYGSRLKLNPVAVLVGVMFWWALWGVAGAFVAVPIVATLKIVADRVEALKPLGEFLGE